MEKVRRFCKDLLYLVVLAGVFVFWMPAFNFGQYFSTHNWPVDTQLVAVVISIACLVFGVGAHYHYGEDREPVEDHGDILTAIAVFLASSFACGVWIASPLSEAQKEFIPPFLFFVGLAGLAAILYPAQAILREMVSFIPPFASRSSGRVEQR